MFSFYHNWKNSEKLGGYKKKSGILCFVNTQSEFNMSYLSHVTPLSGHGKIIAATIYKYLKEENLLDQPIYVIGTVMLKQKMEPSTS